MCRGAEISVGTPPPRPKLKERRELPEGDEFEGWVQRLHKDGAKSPKQTREQKEKNKMCVLPARGGAALLKVLGWRKKEGWRAWRQHDWGRGRSMFTGEHISRNTFPEHISS